MFTAILVDDEYWALKGIYETFQWETTGFRVIAQVTKSTEALELILRENPDAVFTDIRMPKISGIELMKKVREAGLNTEFVVISGFGEFVYAQQAIQQGAFDYCLKPLELDIAAALLQRLEEHLKAKQEKRSSEIFEFLMDHTYEAGERLITEGLKDSRRFYQAVVTIGTSRDVEALLAGADILPVRLGSNKMLYLANTDEDVFGRLEKQNLSQISIGVSRTGENPGDFSRLYLEADVAASGCFILEEGGVFQYKKRNVVQTDKIVSLIVAQIGQKDAGPLKKAVGGIPEFFRQNGLGVHDLAYLWNQVALHLLRKYPCAEDGTLMGLADHQMLLRQFSDIGSFTESLYSQVLDAGSVPEAGTADAGTASSVVFKELLQFMQGHYMEPLYLRELAKKYYLNQSYCCYLFKKYTDGTFTEYLNHCRVEHAKELLADTALSIEQISQRAGYNDYFYFNKVFKKYCGITPAKYRKGNLRQTV